MLQDEMYQDGSYEQYPGYGGYQQYQRFGSKEDILSRERDDSQESLEDFIDEIVHPQL